MRLGLLSTANINRAILAGAAKTDRVDVVAVGKPRRAAGGGVRRGARDRDGARLLPGAPRRPRCRGRLHLAPERHAPRVDDAGARGRKARPLREALHAPSRRGRGSVRRRGRRGARPGGGVHVSPPSADRGGRPTRRRRRGRTALRREGDLHVPPPRPLGRSRAARARRRRADGRRLLLRQRDPPAGGRAGARARRAGHGDDGDRHGVPRDAPLCRRRRRPVRGVVPLAAAAVARGGRRGRACSLSRRRGGSTGAAA